MGTGKTKVYQTPFKNDQTQTNTFAPVSIADTSEAQAFQDVPLDFGDPVSVDPGIARRTDLAEQAAENRYNSAFNFNVPRIFRERALASEQRGIREQGAAEMRQAEYLNQQANNAMRERKTLAELGRKERLLPNIYQTGGTGTSSGFNSQVVQPQPGFLQRLALTAAGGASAGLATRNWG